MKPPRALAVPFELGRPFGAPNEVEFQRKVLHNCLELLERESGPVLEDFLICRRLMKIKAQRIGPVQLILLRLWMI